MLTFAVEPIAGVWEEKVKCSAEHWKETNMYRSGEVLNPLFERYHQYEKSGYYFEIVARDEAGVMAGFCGMYLVPSMHTQAMQATEDIIYLKPEYRKGRNGHMFYKFIEDEMRRRGAKKIMATAPPGSVASRILENLGCSLTSYGYEKLLT